MSKGAAHWITGYDVAETVLRHKAFREVTFKGLTPLLGHVIVTMEGSAHRERRTLENRLFTLPFLLKAEQNLITETIATVLTGLAENYQACLVEISYSVMTQIAAHIIGLDELQAGHNSAEAVGLLSALVSGKSSQHHHNDQAPLTRRAARDELRRKYIDKAISRRRNLIAQFQANKLPRHQLPHDLITLLLLHPPEGSPPLDTRQIAAEVAFYAVAAIDTTSNLVPHLLHELWNFTARYPEYRPFLDDLSFLRRAAAEALRLHPAIPTIFREATSPVEVAGLHFEVGQVAAIYVSEANRDSAIFGDDAADFNPLRHIRPKVRRAGLSFGGGSHLCLGRELATGRENLRLSEPKKAEDETGLYGAAAQLAQALLQLGARPDPDNPVSQLSPFERDVYSRYPIIFL